MGDPRRLKKKYKKPKHPFQKERLMEELGYLGKYGLRNKRELWKAHAILGKWREIARQSRRLIKDKAVIAQQELIRKLNRLGVLGPEAQFEDVLLLTVDDVLKRRLQTMVFEKGLASTIYQARQYIVHGQIQVGGRKVDAPSYFVKKDDEDTLTYAASSSLSTKKSVEEHA